ncbi:MAG: hypothetical protein B5M52_04580 [Helicobacteraceae bacterium 4484_230]|nr:MAG: hypothetical protein B5M52_04580 [Helicobacteraceae bacterium 4484_230]
MQLKFVGPKPIITQTGITFDNNKEDRFIYLNIAVQLLTAFNNDRLDNKVYTYDVQNRRLSNEEIIEGVRKYCDDIDDIVEIYKKHAEAEIENNLKHASENMLISDKERSALIKNINMMSDYIIQRSVNKAVYFRVIKALTEELKKEKIDYVVAPMFENFAHIFHAIQGILQEQKFPIDTNIEIFEEDGKLLIKLKIKNL